MVANAVKDGITYYKYENIKKNHFVAVATEDPSDNWGLPFWLGKVVQKKEQCPELRAEDHSEEEDLEDGVLVEEYAQSQRNPVAAGKGKIKRARMKCVWKQLQRARRGRPRHYVHGSQPLQFCTNLKN